MNMRNKESNEKDSLVLVLNELIEQQKELVTKLSLLENTVTSLQEKLNAFEKKLVSLQVSALPTNTAPIQAIISENMREIKTTLAEQPKNVVQEKRLLLFPEYNAREYYSVVLRWVLYIIISTFCFLLLKHLINHLKR